MVRRYSSPYAGEWYPAETGSLTRLFEQVFERSAARTGTFLPPDPVAYVVPHAAPVYSGTVAAAAYRGIQQARPRRVVLLGFSHRTALPRLCIPDVDVFQTPLGEVEVDREAVTELCRHPLVSMAPAAVACDHSVDIQIPFLVWSAPGAQVIPLYAGAMTAEERSEAAGLIAGLLDGDTVVVASSDLTHYGREFGYVPFPANRRAAERLRELDGSVIEATSSLDAAVFAKRIRETGATVCGRAPVGLLLETLQKTGGEPVYQGRLDYQTSGEISGDYRMSVSYGALGYFPLPSFWLDESAGGMLLESARRTLAHYLETGIAEPVMTARGIAQLERREGVFVAVTERGKLMGCVGTKAGCEPLREAVARCMVSVVRTDPRWAPSSSNSGDFEIEISLLSPMKLTADRMALVPGVDGGMLRCGRHEAVLLPQVASERNWNTSQFLDALARKAGSDCTVYRRDDTQVFTFRAQCFGDGGAERVREDD